MGRRTGYFRLLVSQRKHAIQNTGYRATGAGTADGCTQATPGSEPDVADTFAQGSEADAPEPDAPGAPFIVEMGEDGESDIVRPTTEQEMHCCRLEVMEFPPPLGIHGALTFAVLPMPGDWDPQTHPVRMEGENGLTADLRIVRKGGVKAIGRI